MVYSKLGKNVFMTETVSQESDVAHGPLVHNIGAMQVFNSSFLRQSFKEISKLLTVHLGGYETPISDSKKAREKNGRYLVFNFFK